MRSLFSRRNIIFLILAVLFSTISIPVKSQVIVPWDFPSFYLENLKEAINSVVSGNSNEFYYYTRKLDDLEKDFVYWFELYNSCPDDKKLESFMKEHKNWPNPVKYSKKYEVITVYSLKKVEYYCDNKRKSTVFLNYDMLDEDLQSELINKLLWKKDFVNVNGLIHSFSNDDKKVIKARMLLQSKLSYADRDLLFLSTEYQKDFGLVYDYIMWYVKIHGLNDKIIEIISLLPYSEKYSDNLWNLYKLCIRTIIYNKRSEYYNFAYKLASNWSNTQKKFLHEAYWLAGWLSFEFLNDKKSSYKYFKEMYKIVSTPVSLSRAAYWLARVYENDNNLGLAFRWYKIASLYNTTFYGQLALLKTRISEIKLDSEIYYKSRDYLYCKKNVFAKIAYLAIKINHNKIAEIFIDHAIKNAKNYEEIAIISELSLENDLHNMAIKTAKVLEYKGVIMAKSLFPINTYLQDNNFDASIMFAIIRQESNFNQYARSHVGASGLMQLMPNTAKEVAKSLGIDYNESDLFNPQYNVRLGNKYLSSMLKNYNNSILLAAAAYNAGQSNVNKWIKELGDPKKVNSIEELVLWIESIPFSETRDYVQRVIENLNIYKTLLKDNKQQSIDYLEQKFFKIV